MAEDVVDDAAEERDVRPGPDRHVQVGHRARAREPRVDVDDLGAALLGFDHHWKPTGCCSAMFECRSVGAAEEMHAEGAPVRNAYVLFEGVFF